MVPAPCATTAPVPPPAYHRAQAQRGAALHLDALTLIGRLHLLAACRLAACRLAVRLARRRCVPPLPAGAGGRPRHYQEESLLLLGLLRTLWRLSYQDLQDWLVAWPALAGACGLPADVGCLLMRTAGRTCPAPPSSVGARPRRAPPRARRCSCCWCTWPSSSTWSGAAT